MPLVWAATLQPSQIRFVQHELMHECSPIGSGIGRVQIEQKSPFDLSRPWLYSRSPLSSAARRLHAFLCCLR